MKQQGNILIILTIIVVFLAGLAFYNQSKPKSNPTQPTSTNTLAETKTFQSKNLKFSITVPSIFQVEEKFTTVLISKGDNQIMINRNGTNFDKIEDYIKDLGIKNHFVILNKTSSQINGLEAISGKIEETKIYFLYKNNAVYSFSTNSEALYNDLDQIAQSFKYTP